MASAIVGMRRHHLTYYALPKFVGWHVKLEFYERLIYLPDGEVIEAEPETFTWERVNIDRMHVMAGYNAQLHKTAAHLAIGDKMHDELVANARFYGYTLLVDAPIGRLVPA